MIGVHVGCVAGAALGLDQLLRAVDNDGCASVARAFLLGCLRSFQEGGPPMSQKVTESQAPSPPTDRSDSDSDEDENEPFDFRPPKERMLGYNYV